MSTDPSNPAQHSPLLASLFPPGVAAAELRAPGDPALLPAEEARQVERAIAKRAGEFAAGRLCARRALTELGFAGTPLPTRADGQPQWPAGVVGSITHTAGFGGAVVGSRNRFRSLGIDAERIGRVRLALWPRICTADELGWLDTLPERERAPAAALVFCAKEAFYKAQYPLSQQWLAFHDASLGIDRLDSGRFVIHLHKAVAPLNRDPAALRGRFRVENELVVCGMSL